MIGRRKDENLGKKIAIGAAVAAAAGYVAGMLTAPKSGKETRKDLQHAATKSVAEIEKDLRKLHVQLDDTIDEAKAKASRAGKSASAEIDDLVATAKNSREKVSGLLDTVRGEKKVDKELKKAISDANDAIEHLKKYLSK